MGSGGSSSPEAVDFRQRLVNVSGGCPDIGALRSLAHSHPVRSSSLSLHRPRVKLVRCGTQEFIG
jgi:hypothetical protein